MAHDKRENNIKYFRYGMRLNVTSASASIAVTPVRDPQSGPPSPCKQWKTLPLSLEMTSTESGFPSMDKTANTYLLANSGQVRSLIGRTFFFAVTGFSESFFLPRFNLRSPVP